MRKALQTLIKQSNTISRLFYVADFVDFFLNIRSWDEAQSHASHKFSKLLMSIKKVENIWKSNFYYKLFFLNVKQPENAYKTSKKNLHRLKMAFTFFLASKSYSIHLRTASNVFSSFLIFNSSAEMISASSSLEISRNSLLCSTTWEKLSLLCKNIFLFRILHCYCVQNVILFWF